MEEFNASLKGSFDKFVTKITDPTGSQAAAGPRVEASRDDDEAGRQGQVAVPAAAVLPTVSRRPPVAMIDTTSEDDVGEEAAADCAETVCVCIQYFANWRVKIAHIDTRSDPKPPKSSRARPPPGHLAQGLANLPDGSAHALLFALPFLPLFNKQCLALLGFFT